MAKSDYLENKLLDHALGTAALTAPATVYLALSTADPTDAGTGIAEPAGNGYARQAAAFGAASAGSASNSGTITFGAATANWGTITHVAVFDALTGGNMLYHGAMAASKVVNNTESLEFAAGAVTITEA